MTAPSSSATPGRGSAANTPAEIRRRSGEQPLRLTPYYGADLDSTAVDWEVNRYSSVQGYDLYVDGDSRIEGGSGVDFAPVADSPTIDTCRVTTEYYGSLDLGTAQVGYTFCVRTTERRYAFVTVLDLSGPVQLDVIVFDPPRPN